MLDCCGRNIDYLRLSLTDRCNLRCRYCMPDGVQPVEHRDMLTYEELLQVAEAAVELGITHFKVTGGEPLVRRGCAEFLERLKGLPGAETVTLTTNGVLLEPLLPRLSAMGLDGVNISLDSLNRAGYEAIAGRDELETVASAVRACAASGLNTKLNCVLLEENRDQLVPLVEFADRQNIDIRFIELMPIGAGGRTGGPSGDEALELLRRRWPDLHPVEEHRGFGPARYWAEESLNCRVGMIAAMSHSFCDRCNRVRLTGTGRLKPCLCYGDSADLRSILRNGGGDLKEAMAAAIRSKPERHRFNCPEDVTERDGMNQIGG